MSENTVSVKLEASYAGFQSAFTKAREFMSGVVDGMKQELKDMSDAAKADTARYESTMEQFGNVVQNRFKGINGAIAGVRAAWAQLAVVIGAGMGAVRAANEASRYNQEIMALSRSMGITTQAASALALAIGDNYGTSQEFIAASRTLNLQVRRNEAAMNSMGVVTRDSNGELLDQQQLMMNGLSAVRSYEEGTSRNMAAQRIFGNSIQANSELLRLNQQDVEAAAVKAQELNLVVGQQSVEATDEYRAAINDLEDVLQGMKVAIGNEVMPVLTELAKFFAEIGPTAILAMRSALAILMSLFRGLKLAVYALYEVIAATFSAGSEYVSAFGEVLSKLLSGDFAGAQAAAQNVAGNMAGIYSEAFGRIADEAASTGEAITDQWSNLVFGPSSNATTASTEGGDRQFNDPAAAERAARERAAAERRAEAEAKRLRDAAYRDTIDRLNAELAEWKNNYDERLRIAQQMMDAAAAAYGTGSAQYREASQKYDQIDRERIARQRALEEQQRAYEQEHRLQNIEEEQREADFLLQMGELTVQQRIEQEVAFQDRIFEIKRKALEDKLALMEADPDANPEVLAQLKEQLYQIEFEHQSRINDLRRQGQEEANRDSQEFANSLTQGWSDTVAKLVTGQMTLKEAWAALWKQALQSFTQFLAQKLAQSVLFAKLEIAVQKMINAVMRMLGIQSATTAVATKGSETTAKIGQSAATAGAGAAESQASIPYIGPVLAIAAMAAIFAAVMGMKGKAGSSSISSAEGGYDIPAGVNPLAQLHKREMVLPEAHADVIRGLAENGAAGGGVVNFAVNAVDAEGVRRLLMSNKRALADTIRSIIRDNVR